VSINAFARFARSIFKEKFRKTYVRDCGLALPDVSEFCNEELAAPARHVKEAPPLDLVEKTFQEANKLRASDRDAYIAFLLTMCSLRRGEAQQMQWDWILWEQRAVRVPRASKSKVVRLVPVPAPVLEELRQYRALRTASIEEQLQHMDPRRPARAEATRARLEADRAFVLPAGTKWNPGNKSRANWVLDRVDALMRGCGWETQHTVHELRAYYLRHLRQTFGLEVAGEAGGHADLRVTRTHYTGLLDVSAINVPMPLDNP
jgi:integrase